MGARAYHVVAHASTRRADAMLIEIDPFCRSVPSVLKRNLLASSCLGPGSPHEVILIKNCPNAAAGLNFGIVQGVKLGFLFFQPSPSGGSDLGPSFSGTGTHQRIRKPRHTETSNRRGSQGS
jgi:hypothetical protein